MGINHLKERFDELRGELWEWLDDLLENIEVVHAEESDPRPDGPHLVFKIKDNLVKQGSLDELVPATDSRPARLRSYRTMQVSFEAIGDPVSGTESYSDKIRATDILNEVQLSFDRPETQDTFRALGLAVFDDGVITDVSELLETEIEPRATLDVVFSIRIDVDVDPGIIESMEASGAFDSDMDGVYDDILTGTFEVPQP